MFIVRNVSLKIENLELSTFKFMGTLQSDLVDSSELEFSFWEDSLEIEGTELDEFDGFCARVFLTPKTAFKINLTLVLYPLSLSQLTQEFADIYQDVRFPGLQVTRREIICGIPTKNVNQSPWGSPVLPALKIGSQEISEESRPRGLDMLRGLFSLMGKAALPELKSNVKATMDRWTVILEGGSSHYRSTKCDFVWPDPPTIERTSTG